MSHAEKFAPATVSQELLKALRAVQAGQETSPPQRLQNTEQANAVIRLLNDAQTQFQGVAEATKAPVVKRATDSPETLTFNVANLNKLVSAIESDMEMDKEEGITLHPWLDKKYEGNVAAIRGLKNLQGKVRELS